MDGTSLQAGAEGFGELVEATCVLGKAAGVKRGEQVRVGGMRLRSWVACSVPAPKGEETSFIYALHKCHLN